MSLAGLLRRALPTAAEAESTAGRDVAAAAGCAPIARLRPRSRQRVGGVLRSVTLRPGRDGELHAELFDGTGALRLVWLGRRTIPGIAPGRRLVVEGMVADSGGTVTMFNPHYELRTEA